MLWIVGAKGLLGSTLCAKCKAVLHVQTGKEVDIGNLGDLRKFFRHYPGITHIINASAFSLVDAAETNREEAYRTNGIGPHNLSLLAKEMGAKLVHVSTDYVFPGNIHRPLLETDIVGPCNFYGETKLKGEQGILPEHLIIRTSWLFGDGGKNFVAKLLQMLMTQKEIRLTNDQWGRPTYAPDLADAILNMRDASGLFHYANQGVTTRYEFGCALREKAIELGFQIATESIVPVPSSSFSSPCKRPVYSAFSTNKIEQHLPIRHWRQALKEFLCAQLPIYS